MNKKNLLSGRDKELHEMAEQYEASRAANQPIYLDAEDLADLTDWYATRSKYELAKDAVEYGLNMHPGNTDLLTQEAYLYIDAGNIQIAQEIVNQISDDYLPEVKILKANLLMRQGETDEAEDLLDTIEDKEDLANIVEASYMYLDTGYPEKALEWLSRGQEMYSDEESYIAVTADCYYAQGLVEKASSFYNKLIDKNPYSAPYWFGLARCYFDQQMLDKAIEACDYAIISDEEFTDAYIMRGHAFFQLGNGESAYENYALAGKYNALSTDVLHMFMGLSKLSSKKWDTAYDHLQKALDCQEPDSPVLSTLYSQAAFCLFKLGKKRKANQYFKKSHELDSNDVDAYLLEGRAYMENEDYEKGVKNWAKALEISPTADIWNEIGMYSVEMGQLDYAKMAFEQVQKLEPDFEKINEKLAALCLILKDKENFQKYNRLCDNPIDMDVLKELEDLLQSEDCKDLLKMLRHII